MSVQTWQIEELGVLPELGTATQAKLDVIHAALDKIVRKPGKLSLDGFVLTVGTTEVEIGPEGKKLGFSPLGGAPLGSIEASFDFSAKDSLLDGPAGTGDFVTVDFPVLTAGEYVKVGFEIRDDKKIYLVPGLPANSLASASEPEFLAGSIPLGMIWWQAGASGVDYSGTIDWEAVVDQSSVLQFLSGAGGGGAGSVAVTVDQVAHGLSLGEPVYFNNVSGWVGASGLPDFATGIVSKVLNPDKCVVSLAGLVELSGLNPGSTYYLANGTVQADVIVPMSAQKLYVAIDTENAFLTIEPVRFAEKNHLLRQAGTIAYQDLTSLFLNEGVIELDDGLGVLIGTAEGSSSHLEVDLDVLMPSPIADTTYYLYGDLFANDKAITTDTGRELYHLADINSFVLTTTNPQYIDHFRYVCLAVVRRQTSAWGELGVGIQSHNLRKWDRVASNLIYTEINSVEYTTSGQKTFVHNLSGKPQSIEIRYFDGSLEQVLHAPSYVSNVNETEIVLEFGSFVFVGGDRIEVIASYTPNVGNQFVGNQTQYQSSWLDSTSIVELTHGLLNGEAIKGLMVIEHDITASKYRVLELTSIVESWDDTKIYLNWTGYAPSSTLKYQVVSGGSPLPSSIATYFGGFTKFVGKGPGFYASLADALAEAVEGDRVLVLGSQTLASELTVSALDIAIVFAPGTSVNKPITVTGSGVVVEGVKFAQSASDTWAHAVRIEGDNVSVDRMVVSVGATGTVTDIVNVQASAEFASVSATFKSNGGTVTNPITDLGTDSDLLVRGA